MRIQYSVCAKFGMRSLIQSEVWNARGDGGLRSAKKWSGSVEGLGAQSSSIIKVYPRPQLFCRFILSKYTQPDES